LQKETTHLYNYFKDVKNCGLHLLIYFTHTRVKPAYNGTATDRK